MAKTTKQPKQSTVGNTDNPKIGDFRITPVLYFDESKQKSVEVYFVERYREVKSKMDYDYKTVTITPKWKQFVNKFLGKPNVVETGVANFEYKQTGGWTGQNYYSGRLVDIDDKSLFASNRSVLSFASREVAEELIKATKSQEETLDFVETIYLTRQK